MSNQFTSKIKTCRRFDKNGSMNFWKDDNNVDDDQARALYEACKQTSTVNTQALSNLKSTTVIKRTNKL